MKVKNKLTKETLDIPYSQFRIKFAKEIQDAFESYRKTQINTLGTSKMTILWSLIFILSFLGILRLSGRGLKRQRARLMSPNKKTTLYQIGI